MQRSQRGHSSEERRGGLNLESGVVQVGRTHLLRQEVNVLFVASLWGAVELHQSQGLAFDGTTQLSFDSGSFLAVCHKANEQPYLGRRGDGEDDGRHRGAAEVQQATLRQRFKEGSLNTPSQSSKVI